MAQGDNDPLVAPEIASALAELLAQTKSEPISPRLRGLAQQLETALDQARLQRLQGECPQDLG